jgi:hypothetical protein
MLIRVTENATADTWRNTRHELGRPGRVTLATACRVAQRSGLTPGHKSIVAALDLPEPPATSTSPSPAADPQTPDRRPLPK